MPKKAPEPASSKRKAFDDGIKAFETFLFKVVPESSEKVYALAALSVIQQSGYDAIEKYEKGTSFTKPMATHDA